MALVISEITISGFSRTKYEVRLMCHPYKARVKRIIHAYTYTDGICLVAFEIFCRLPKILVLAVVYIDNALVNL